VKFVKSAQRLGFSLDEVAQLLRLEDGTHCKEVASLAALRLADVRSRLADLKRMETASLRWSNSAVRASAACPAR
jgi:MerR family mercuric resistance operon transcriptional regulator